MRTFMAAHYCGVIFIADFMTELVSRSFFTQFRFSHFFDRRCFFPHFYLQVSLTERCAIIGPGRIPAAVRADSVNPALTGASIVVFRNQTGFSGKAPNTHLRQESADLSRKKLHKSPLGNYLPKYEGNGSLDVHYQPGLVQARTACANMRK
jgi:hypothetical protein